MKKDFKSVSILVIGNIGPWLEPENTLPQIKDTIFCLYADLTLAFLEEYQPDMILSPLVSTQYDIVDLAIKLSEMNFIGQLRAICAPLPNLENITEEVRFESPDIDFDLIVVKPGRNLRSV